MMSRRLELERRRATLQTRCAAQRQELIGTGNAIAARLERIDRAVIVFRRVLSAPVIIGVALSLLVFVGPRRLLRWVQPAILLVSTARRLARH